MAIDIHPEESAYTGRRTSGLTGEGSRQAAERSGASAGDDNDFSFWDLVDIVNPLQHFPVVSSIYREVTGDEIKAPFRIMGGFLFGGVIGMASGIINAILEETTGKDVGEHVMSMFDGEDDPAGSTRSMGYVGPPGSANGEEAGIAELGVADPATAGNGTDAGTDGGEPLIVDIHPLEPAALRPEIQAQVEAEIARRTDPAAAPANDVGHGPITLPAGSGIDPNRLPDAIADALRKYEALGRGNRAAPQPPPALDLAS